MNAMWFPGVTKEEEEKVNAMLIKNKEDIPIQNFHRKFIDSLMTLDQSVRGGLDRNDTHFWDELEYRDSLNRILFLDFTRKYGAPGGVNAGWDQSIGTFFLHLPKEWLIEHEGLLVEEVRKGNLEPWCLARGIDRMWAEGETGNITSPNGFYHNDTNEQPDVVFENCVKIGASPYFNFPIHQLKEGKYFNFYKENKSRYSCVKL